LVVGVVDIVRMCMDLVLSHGVLRVDDVRDRGFRGFRGFCCSDLWDGMSFGRVLDLFFWGEGSSSWRSTAVLGFVFRCLSGFDGIEDAVRDFAESALTFSIVEPDVVDEHHDVPVC
jgi:hypothetical protein